jgi:hypothetical protein
MMAAISGAFPFAPTLTRSDNENHAPGPEANWQESTLVALVDPQRGLAGFHRIGIHPNRNEASLYSWTQVGGKMVSRAKCTGLAVPTGPLTGAALAGVTLQTPDPLRTCRIKVDRDGVKTDLLFESFTGPVQMNMDVAGASIGAGHYDSLGRVYGSIESGGTSHPFDGVGFLDHSWGPRDGGTILAHRWIMAVLDAANHINAFPTWGPKGRVMLGYMVLDGTFSYVADVRSELYVGDDHLGLNGIRATITDKLGRTLEVHGRAAGEYNVQPYGQGYFCAHKPMIYEAQGRVWRGMVEWSAMRFIPPWHREALGLAKDDEWLQWNGRQP